MGQNLKGTEARIWGLHDQGFAVSCISGLVGFAEDYVRNVITGAWLDDKLSAKSKAA
ncbi:MAG: hypothetical protein IJG88_05630 [Eggerthellaceae bacterium]|nr:hypothetical protein [Eggerthellaceae bacterium]